MRHTQILDKADAKRGVLPIANLIGLCFGGLWAVAGSLAFSGTIRVVFLTVAAVTTASLIVRVCCRPPDYRSQGTMFHRWPYLIAVVLEVLAIRVAVALLTHYGAERYLLQAVGIIVGLHFIGLWKASQSSRFLLISAGMCVVSALSIMAQPATAGVRAGDVLAGFGNALVLWLGASL